MEMRALNLCQIIINENAQRNIKVKKVATDVKMTERRLLGTIKQPFNYKLGRRAVLAKDERKISDKDTLDIVLKRLAGDTLEKVAKSYGVSKQTIQYHEGKELAGQLREIILRQAAEYAGNAIGKLALDNLLESRLVDNQDTTSIETLETEDF